MRIAQDARFREERAQYGLQFCCEGCAAFDPDAPACAYDYPVADHRLARYADPEAELVFCKAYEPV
ncbi:MAG: hypothetical protein KF729_23665 [Sandaracinaceae bacterium]|nr:hypothetical protein [Sandaracinaceae bacterium]